VTDDRALHHLILRAQEMGIHYLGTDPAELDQLLDRMARAREGKPACYLRSFSPTGVCRTCDYAAPCGAGTIIPSVDPDPIGLVECNQCDGDLFVLLYDDRGDVVDYGCSTPGCRNTMQRQQDG